MGMKCRAWIRIAVVAASIGVGLGAVLVRPAASAPSVAGDGVGGAAGGRTLAIEYADRIQRLVQNGKIAELSQLALPKGTTQVSKLRDWTEEYLAQIQLQEKQRDKQYADAVAKAQTELKADRYDKAMGPDGAMLAYRIAKDPEAFLQLPWVKEMTAKVAARAADLEKQGQWLESLSLYSDLNTLYEVDTRYKADMQRLNRRARLLAVYAPKALLEMRRQLAEAQRDPASTAPATKPDEAADLAGFTRWQDYTENITLDMMRRVLQNSQENWVENTTYQTLARGGLDALRLFLTTPQLATEFTGLAGKTNRDKFDAALNDATAAITANDKMDVGDVQVLVEKLLAVSQDSVKLPNQVLIMEFTDGALDKLDQFSSVIWPHEVPEFEKNINGEFGGVGIQISMDNGQLKVISPLEDTPAYKAGIEAGDLITAIDGKSTLGISVDKAVSSIMGTPGTPVTLRIKRGDSEREYAIRRAIIKVVSVKGVDREAQDPTKWNFLIDPDSKIGYVRITAFQQGTADELAGAISALKTQGMRGLILDLRFNPGGLLGAAVEMSDMFLDSGTIVSTRGRSARARPSEWKADGKMAVPVNMPMSVLVNEYSASASEIFAGAMKDLHRATIIGHRTFGKGSVQQVLHFGTAPSGLPESELKLTMAYYYLPMGENLHRRDGSKTWGVDPDIAVDLTPDQLNDLVATRRNRDIIRPSGPGTASAPASAPAATATADAPAPDTQLETALLMMRLQLIQSHS
jgi:carboxyl-terminal processing protease